MSHNVVRRIIVSTAKAPGAIGPYNQVIRVTMVDVIITIFNDFCQFSAENLSFSQKNNVMFYFL
jgi:hypothetical protein